MHIRDVERGSDPQARGLGLPWDDGKGRHSRRETWKEAMRSARPSGLSPECLLRLWHVWSHLKAFKWPGARFQPSLPPTPSL